MLRPSFAASAPTDEEENSASAEIFVVLVERDETKYKLHLCITDSRWDNGRDEVMLA
jgi:hypothetical protein